MYPVDSRVGNNVYIEGSKVIDSDLGIEMRELGDGRRKFEMDVGSLGRVEVLDIAGTVITEDEWRLINLARDSYRQVWGGGKTLARISEDPFEGRPPCDGLYSTTHQIADLPLQVAV